MDQATVKMTALRVIFDLLHLFGLDTFNVDSHDSEEDDADVSKDSGGNHAHSDFRNMEIVFF